MATFGVATLIWLPYTAILGAATRLVRTDFHQLMKFPNKG
jgi:hypothetical protein